MTINNINRETEMVYDNLKRITSNIPSKDTLIEATAKIMQAKIIAEAISNIRNIT
jgi:hypothetical protein